jgi:hypothetical protein
MTTETTIKKIRNMIAQDELDEAIKQLQLLLENSPKLEEAILQSARFHDIRTQIRLGTVSHSEMTLTRNQIRASLLDLLHEIEDSTAETSERPDAATLRKEMEGAVSIVNSKNVVIDSTISAGGDIHIGDKTITQNADKIYNIDKIDNANFF